MGSLRSLLQGLGWQLAKEKVEQKAKEVQSAVDDVAADADARVRAYQEQQAREKAAKDKVAKDKRDAAELESELERLKKKVRKP